MVASRRVLATESSTIAVAIPQSLSSGWSVLEEQFHPHVKTLGNAMEQLDGGGRGTVFDVAKQVLRYAHLLRQGSPGQMTLLS